MRLVRLLLGSDAIAERKLETGNPLVVLGIQCEANLGGVSFTPAPEKVKAWKLQITGALKDGKLYSGEASKLAGKYLSGTADADIFGNIYLLCVARQTWLRLATSV